MTENDYIFGIRAVIEAIESGKEIDKILIKKGLSGDLFAELLSILKPLRIPVQYVPIEKLNRVTRKNHQGVIAYLSAVTYYNIEHLVPELYEQGVLPFIVILDGITDVRNFGAIARTCDCCGANAIVIPDHGSVGVGADAVKTSAGALMHLPVCRVRNLVSTVKYLKENGYQIVACTEKADVNYTTGNYTGPVAVVMGAEDTGISQAILNLCDVRASIPMMGNIESLNVSVAAGVMMYEVVRQRLNADLEVV